jgi:hypothetical protein
MTPANVLANARLQIGWLGCGSGLVAKQRSVDIRRGALSSASDNELSIPLLPDQDGPRTNPELSAHFGWNGNLALRRDLGMQVVHARTLPR